MRRVINWLLVLLALAALAAGAAERLGFLHSPVQPTAFGVAAAVFAALLLIRSLPLKVRRPVVFLVTLACLGALTAGLAYFQFVIKPNIVKGFISAAFAPKPTTVSVEEARIEQWPPQLTAIGTMRAYQGINIAPQVAGVISSINFDSGDDVEAGQLLINIDDSVERADLANGLAQLRNAETTPARQRSLVAGGNTPAIDARIRGRGPGFRGGDCRSHARGDRPEGDSRALRGPARPAQRRSRTICRRRREPRHLAAARSDLRRLSCARGRAGDARRRPGRRR